MDTVEASPRGLSKLRLNKRTMNASTTSLNSASAAGDDDSEAPSGKRASIDAAIEKVKQRTKKSMDERSDSKDGSAKRLSNLLTRRKRPSKHDLVDASRRLSVQSGDVRSQDGSISPSRSESSLVGSGRSSLLTDDASDVEGKPIRPVLSPHQSHTGFITLSSPELNAQTRPVLSEIPSLEPPEPSTTPDPTAPVPQIVEPANTKSAPDSTIRARSPSRGRSAKAPFSIPIKLGRENSDSSSTANNGGGGGLGGLFRPKSRRGSAASGVQAELDKDSTSADDPEVSVPELQPQDTTNKSRDQPQTPKKLKNAHIQTTSLPSTPPNLVETPTTLITPPTPTDPSASFLTRTDITSSPQSASSKDRQLNSVESIRHRRAQSANLPSRLSNSVTAPLTPTVEETKTPGGTLVQPSGSSSFFTNFISAAQKAADQISSNTFATQNKGKGLPSQVGGDQAGISVGSGQVKQESAVKESDQPASEIAGNGDRDLSDLGADVSRDQSPMSSGADLHQQGQITHDGEAQKADEAAAAARAVSVAYEKPVQNVISQATGRPMSIASTERLSLHEGQTTPRSATDADTIKRSGSVRSRLSGHRRKHRGSAATNATSSTIAAAIHASTSALVNPGTTGAGHRHTGFAVASSRRNKDFHLLFRSVPEDDYLIEDYSAALQRDILLHGRLYISEGYICFSSNILGWVTNLVINFDEVISVEKKNTAVIFPNAIVIQTANARNVFASLVARDSTYELLIGIWKVNHPNLKSSLNGATLDDAGTGDKTEVVDPDGSDEASSDDSDDVYDEDEDDDAGSFTDAGVLASNAGSDFADGSLSRKPSDAPLSAAPQLNGSTSKAVDAGAAAATTTSESAEFPGTQSHAPTECGESGEHYDRPLTDTTIPAPLGRVYSLMFGPASGAFMRKWLVEDQKSRELNLADDKKGLDNDHKSMTFDYIKPLNAPVGPRQTKCITTNTLVGFDLDRAVSVDCSTSTPDVPSGNVFTTKTRYCLMWGPGNSTRIIANCTIEWTGKSWLKGPIEKGANDGQIEYVKALTAALKAAVTSKTPVRGPVKKGRRKGTKDVLETQAVQTPGATAVSQQQQRSNWGPLEPLHQILEPLAAIFQPLVSSQAIIIVLLIMLLYSWMSPRSRAGVGFAGSTPPERLVAYEEMWRREESQLWDWLEDRVGLDHLYAPAVNPEKQDRRRILAARDMAKSLEDERMSERQMDDAIRLTEERLTTLKMAIAEKKGKKT